MCIYIYAHSHLQLFYILFILLHNIFPYKVLTYNIIFDDIIFYCITLYWSSLLDIVSKDKKTLKMICIQTGKEWFSVPTCLQASALEIRECRRHILGYLRKGLADRPRKTALDHPLGPSFLPPWRKIKDFHDLQILWVFFLKSVKCLHLGRSGTQELNGEWEE